MFTSSVVDDANFKIGSTLKKKIPDLAKFEG